MKITQTIAARFDTRYQNVLLLFILVGLMVGYMYFLSSAVVNVVVSREYTQSTSEVASAITELEAQYIEAQHTIRREVALQQGFVAVADKTFVTPFDTSLVVEHEER